MKNDRAKLIKKLKKYREANNISIAKLAALLNVSKALIFMWFNGSSQPSKRNVNKIKLLINQHAITSNEIKEGTYVQCDFLDFKHVCGTVKKLLRNMLFIEFDKQHLGTMSVDDYEAFNHCGAVAYNKAMTVIKGGEA